MSEPVKIVDRQSRDFGECLGIVGLLVIETSGLLLRGKQEKSGVVISRARLLQRQQNVNEYAGRWAALPMRSRSLDRIVRRPRGRAAVIVAAKHGALIDEERPPAALAILDGCRRRLVLIAGGIEFETVTVLIQQLFLHQLLFNQLV